MYNGADVGTGVSVGAGTSVAVGVGLGFGVIVQVGEGDGVGDGSGESGVDMGDIVGKYELQAAKATITTSAMIIKR